MKISNSLTLIPLVASHIASVVDCPKGAIRAEHKITLSALTCNFFSPPHVDNVILENGEQLDKQLAHVVLHRGPTHGKDFINYWVDDERLVTVWIEACLPQEVFDAYLARADRMERSAIIIEYFLNGPIDRTFTGDSTGRWNSSQEGQLDIQSVQVRFGAELSDDQTQHLYCRILDQSYGPGVPYYSEKGELWTHIKTLTARYAFDNAWDTATFKAKLEESYQWIERLQCALNPMCHLNEFGDRSLLDESSWASKWLKEGTDIPADRQLEVIWRWRSPKRVLVDGEECGHYWPIGIEDITLAAHYYLQYPWLQCRKADYYLLCGFLYSEYLAFVGSEKPKLPRLAQLMLTGHSNKALGDKKVWGLFLYDVSISLFKACALGVLIFALADQFNWPVALLAGLLTNNIHSIRLAIQRRYEHETTLKRCVLFDQMERDYQLLWDMRGLSPSYLKECFLESTRAGVVWPKPVFAILERAIARDPSEWK